MLKIGSVLDGKYKILSEIGHGGMSVVYLARNEIANKTWAVKEVRKDGINNNEVVRQGLIAETEILKKLHHPNLPSIVDVIDTEDSFIIVMDYIEGQSLQEIIKENRESVESGAQDPEDIIDWAEQLCKVLGYLHDRKPPIIYRDMKPANVMLRPDGQIVLIDFGTAREYKLNGEGDTSWLGTRGYAAPEQFGGHGQTDARTDIYNLGATMYHLLSGLSPEERNFEMNPIGERIPELAGSGIEKILLKCCMYNQADRYQSCDELLTALENVRDLDDVSIRQMKLRWHVFAGGAAVTLAGVIGMIGFSLASGRAINTSYETYISQAQNSANVADKIAYYKEAVDLKPADDDAYTKMLEDFFSDGEISTDEKAGIEKCLNSASSTLGGDSSNLGVFQADNAGGYAKFELTLGEDYFIGYNHGRNDAYNAFKNALESGGFQSGSEDERRAASLCTLTEYYAKLAPMGSDKTYITGSTDGSYSYKNFWKELSEYAADPDSIQEKSGNAGLAAAIYRETATQISTHIEEFKDAGVKVKNMQTAMNNADTWLGQYFDKKPYTEAGYKGVETNKKVVLNAVSAVDQAQEILSSQDTYATRNSSASSDSTKQ